MKNIIWQLPDGRLAIRNLSGEDLIQVSKKKFREATSQECAESLIQAGLVAEDFTPVLYDVDEFPEQPQSTWRLRDGMIVADEELVAALPKTE